MPEPATNGPQETTGLSDGERTPIRPGDRELEDQVDRIRFWAHVLSLFMDPFSDFQREALAALSEGRTRAALTRAWAALGSVSRIMAEAEDYHNWDAITDEADSMAAADPPGPTTASHPPARTE